jgi:hypothetical protein
MCTLLLSTVLRCCSLCERLFHVTRFSFFALSDKIESVLWFFHVLGNFIQPVFLIEKRRAFAVATILCLGGIN